MAAHAGGIPVSHVPQALDANAREGNWRTSGDVYDQYHWSVLGYFGKMTQNELVQDLYFHFNGLGPGDLYSLEINHQLAKDNGFRRFVSPLVSTVELAANGTYETDPNGIIYEFNPYVMFRWRNFPWNQYILTTVGIGEGVSWASRNPQRETRTEEKAENARKFLNYVAFEATMSLPKHPEWQVLYRLHHRSGAFGLYCPGIVGSTAAGIGIRYWFG